MEFQTTEDVARVLKIKAVTAQRWLSEGRLKGTKIGKRWLVAPHDLEVFVKTGGKSANRKFITKGGNFHDKTYAQE
jgi:excisionase family DNA binding protein